MPERARRLLVSPWLIMSLALILRLGNILLHKLYRFPPDLDHIYFGVEMGRVARAMVEGHGFGAVFASDSGPTAWFGPVYPCLLAGVFQLFGVYSNASALVMLAINSVFSALTCVTIYRIAQEAFGFSTAVASSWIWAVLPYAIYWPTHHVWETSLSAFLLTAVFLATLGMESASRAGHWVGFGLLWALIALTNAALLSFLPAALIWLWRSFRRRDLTLARPLVAAGVVFMLAVSPWIVRNAEVFHKFIFPRSDFGVELYLENHDGGTREIVNFHPLWNGAERDRYRALGEIAYVREKGELAREFIRRHPAEFFKHSLQRAVFFWITAPEEARVMRGHRQWARQTAFGAIAVLTFIGLGLSFRNRARGAFLFAGLLLSYPAVYYFTHTESRYYHPLAPSILMLTTYAVSQVAEHISRGKAEHFHLHPVQVEDAGHEG
jgi:4-amino-4-deoxy-L-arabinose transferase-like glycosyltransferase